MPEKWMVTETLWGRGFDRALQNGGTFYMFCEEEIAVLLPRDMGRVPRIQVNRQHLLCGEYCQNETPLFLLTLPKNQQIMV